MHAFENSWIKSITIPSQVTVIEESTFSSCTSLKTMYFSNNSKLKIIKKNAFDNCPLESISLPPNITRIDEYAFNDFQFETFSIPSCLEIFKGIYSYRLKQIIIPPTNKNFKWIDNNNFLLGKSDLNSDEFDILVYSSNDIKLAKIPSYIKYIGPWCFYRRESLQQVEFASDSKLISIGDYAFSYCKINMITIPSHVTTIKDYAFSSCEKLQSVYFSENSELREIGNYAFSFSSIQSFSFPYATTIGDYAFCNCKQLSNISFYDYSNFISIGYQPFYGTPVENIKLPPH